MTDQNGQLTCVTTSTFYPSTFGMTQSPLFFTGINSNAEMYFAGATTTNSAAASVVTDISLSTPYLAILSTTTTANALPAVNLPSTGIFTQSDFGGLKGKRAAGDPTSSVGGYDVSEADYGYVDPFFINFLAQDPNYQKQYPQLAGCLPGGPSIDPGTRVANLVSTPTLALSLTNTRSTKDYVSGCFHTDSPLCATVAPPVPTALPVVAPTPAASPQPAPQPPQAPPTSVAASHPPPNPPSPPIQPISQAYNPNELSPTQLSQLLGALQPTLGTTTPEPSPISPPPPTSLQPSLSPPIVPSFAPSKLTSSAPEPVPTISAQASTLPSPVLSPPPTSLQTSLSPPVLVSAPSESATSAATPVPTTSARTSVLAFPGEAEKSRGKPLWSLLSLCLGCGVLAIL